MQGEAGNKAPRRRNCSRPRDARDPEIVRKLVELRDQRRRQGHPVPKTFRPALEAAEARYAIPGSGRVDSLNVAQAVAVVLGEWWRGARG